jgi:hypothetical protein
VDRYQTSRIASRSEGKEKYWIKDIEKKKSKEKATIKLEINSLYLYVRVTKNSAVSVEAKGDLELDKESDWDWGEDALPGVFFFTLRILDPESGLLLDRDAYSLRLEELCGCDCEGSVRSPRGRGWSWSVWR